MIKTFEEYKEKLWKQVSIGEYLSTRKDKKDLDDYDKVFNLVEDYFDPYQYTGDDNDIDIRGNIVNEYKFNYSKSGTKNGLFVFLKKKKVDIEINVLNDEWYATTYSEYEDYTDNEYYKTFYYICDGFDGLKEWFEYQFGELNESVEYHPSYHEITLEEYRSYYSGGYKFENITEKELSLVKSFLSEINSNDVAIIEMYPIVDEMRNCINIYNGNVNKKQRSRIDNRAVNIDKLKDEWYILIIEDAWPIHDMKDRAYKCDQIDGLIECLKIIYSELNKRLEL
jgi:hypothetical protein